MIDLALWLSPLDGESPSGEDLRNDPRFHELERLAEPEVRVVYDDRNKPSSQSTIPPDWEAVLARAEELRTHGRDLRLLVIVARALANREGVAGLAEGLTLVAQNLEAHWETMHPALRAGAPPREAALRRMNALLGLQEGQGGLLADLRQATFLSPRGIGPVSGRDLERGTLDDRIVLQEAASGLNAAEKAALVDEHARLVSRVRSACAAQADQSAAEMDALVDGTRAALTALGALDDAVNRRLGTSGPSVPELRRFLERLLATIERRPAGRVQAGNGDATAETAPSEPDSPRPNGHVASSGDGGADAMLPSRLTSRDDVVRCLDLVVAFYDRTEPSSPIPHLARRIRRMVHMDFVELMEDLAPSGLKEFRLLAGVGESKKSAQKDER